jgi:GntP family gluconate:H+ symporter
VILIGIPVCAVVAAVGYLVSKKIPIDNIVLGKTPIGTPPTGDEDVSEVSQPDAADNPTRSGLVLFLILAPVIQILIGTVGKMLVPEGTLAHSILSLVGAPLVALLVAVLLAYLSLGRQHHWSLEKRGRIIDDALPNVAVVVFVAGAGGVFASVLVASGIGKALAGVLVSAHLPLLVAAFVISLALRGSQGSATVAILTTAGLLASSGGPGRLRHLPHRAHRAGDRIRCAGPVAHQRRRVLDRHQVHRAECGRRSEDLDRADHRVRDWWDSPSSGGSG